MPLPALPLQVLVVDDHELIRIGIRHLLATRAEVTEAATLADAREHLRGGRFDLLLLDLGLGDDFSLAALPQLRRDWPALKIIVLTSMPEALYAERALRAGAHGYVMKSTLGPQLLQAVQTVLDGGVHLSPQAGQDLLRRMTSHGAAAAAPELSVREMEVLRLVAAGRSTREIAEALNRSVKTIESHKQALKLKLGADTPAALVRQAVARCGDAP